MMWTIILSFILAISSFIVKEWRYYGDINPSSFTKSSTTSWSPSFQIKEEKIRSIIGTGVISDISNQGKYVFDYEGNEYLLYSKKAYSIGDGLRIVWTLQKNMKNDWFSYRSISTWTFAIPFFSGSFDFTKWMKMKWWKGTIYEDNSLLMDVESWRVEGWEVKGWEVENGELGGEELDDTGANWIPDQVENDAETVGNDAGRVGWIKKMKRGIQEKVIEVYGKNRISGLILGMLIGDKSQIPESEYQSFINSGLVHLIAVSGGNILMIVVFLQCILFFFPFYIRLGLILCTITGYSLICGLDSSVFRAVLMGGMSMVALFWGREINIRRLLSMSCIIMLMINPYFLAYDTGFLLSYSALIGIVYFETLKDREKMSINPPPLRGSPPLQKEDKKEWRLRVFLRYVYKSYIAPSIWASIGIFPIIIFFMGKINILGIIGNLFVLPLVPFVMIYGFLSIRIYSLFNRERLLWVEKICVQYIYTISDLLSQYGIYFMVSWLRFKYVVLLVCVLAFVMWRFQKHWEVEGWEVESWELRGGGLRGEK